MAPETAGKTTGKPCDVAAVACGKDVPRCESCGAPKRDFPNWVCYSVWSLLTSPCAVEELSILNCSESGLCREGCVSASSGAYAADQQQESMQMVDLHSPREFALNQAVPVFGASFDECSLCKKDEEARREEERHRASALRRLAKAGADVGVSCIPTGKQFQGRQFVWLGISQCALGAMSDASRAAVMGSPNLRLRLAASRLSLCASSAWSEGFAEIERALQRLEEFALGKRGAGSDSPPLLLRHAFAGVIEGLRFLRLPLSIHPKAAEVWALRRAYFQRALQVSLAIFWSENRASTALNAGTGGGCASFQAEIASFPLQLEFLLPKAQSSPLWLRLLAAELELSAFHMRHRSHNYQAAEHAHRILSSAAKLLTASSGLSDDASKENAFITQSIDALERDFWNTIGAVAPTHFAGSHHSLRLLQKDLQTRLATRGCDGLAQATRWLARELNLDEDAQSKSPTRRALLCLKETTAHADQLATLFPKADAPTQLRVLGLRALLDFAQKAVFQSAEAQGRCPISRSEDRESILKDLAKTREALAALVEEETARLGREGRKGGGASVFCPVKSLREDFSAFCACMEDLQRVVRLDEGGVS